MFLFLSPLTFFGLPLFLFLFLCLSVVLFFFPSFLSFFFAFFLFLVFVSFFPFLSSLLLFHEKKNIKIFNCNFFLKYFLFLLVSCLAFLFQIPFSYLCFFLILSYVFCSTSMFLVSKRTNWKAQKNKKKKPIATKRGFFMNLCFAKCQKLSFFFASFFAKFWLMFKKHYKNRYFSKFLKAKKTKKMHFEVLLSGPSRCYYLGQVDCILKMTNLAQIITPQICARNFFLQKKSAETPIFIVFFDKQCFLKNKLGHFWKQGFLKTPFCCNSRLGPHKGLFKTTKQEGKQENSNKRTNMKAIWVSTRGGLRKGFTNKEVKSKKQERKKQRKKQ